MLRKFVTLALVAGAALAVAGCAGNRLPDLLTPPAAPPPAPTPSAVKQKVLTGCGYVARLESITALLASNPYVGGAQAIADAVCLAATNIPFADGPGDHKPRVNGVVIEGHFVKRRR